jgi:hypothetical protein
MLSDLGMLRLVFVSQVKICSQNPNFNKRMAPSIFLPVHTVTHLYRLTNVNTSV